MPQTRVVFYQDDDGSVPALDWLLGPSEKALVKCTAKIERLAELGHELRRPEADYLRDDIYELRIGLHGINFRILYFFHGATAAILSHGVVKERRVPPTEIDLAVERKRRFQEDPEAHTFWEQ